MLRFLTSFYRHIEPTSKKIKSGFTLIELVIVILLSGVLFGVISVYIATPIKGYVDSVSRARITDDAVLTLIRIEREIKNSVPNSLRTKNVGDIHALEFYREVGGFRYRVSNPGNRLRVPGNNSVIDVFGTFSPSLLSTSGLRVVVYNTGSYGATPDNPDPGVNLWSNATASGGALQNGSHVITPLSTNVTLSNNAGIGTINLSANMRFAFQSPNRRLFLVDTPVSFICDISTGTLRRYSGYTPDPVQPINPNALPLSAATNVSTLATNVSKCNFNYEPGTAQRNAIITLGVTIRDENEQQVRLFNQVRYDNAS